MYVTKHTELAQRGTALQQMYVCITIIIIMITIISYFPHYYQLESENDDDDSRMTMMMKINMMDIYQYDRVLTTVMIIAILTTILNFIGQHHHFGCL